MAGGIAEVRDRQPGMMLLISMAITVAYAASMATSINWLDLEFWWELAALVTIMLLGHWQEMKAIGQAWGALAALAELLPDDAERVGDDGEIETVSLAELRLGDVVLVRSGARVPADGEIVDGEAEPDESMITGESRPVPQGHRRQGRRRHGLDRASSPGRAHPLPRRRRHPHERLCRSAPWRFVARRILLPWALQGTQAGGDVPEIGAGSGAMGAELLATP